MQMFEILEKKSNIQEQRTSMCSKSQLECLQIGSTSQVQWWRNGDSKNWRKKCLLHHIILKQMAKHSGMYQRCKANHAKQFLHTKRYAIYIAHCEDKASMAMHDIRTTILHMAFLFHCKGERNI